ncbi:MAG: DnaA ATPase domain-containing protein [Alphaproteobacteria bacterium]
MKQEILNFKFKNKKDFYVNSKNLLAFNLIQKWPNWNNQFIFLYGPKKCGKTTICNIWKEKSDAFFLSEKKIDDILSNKLNNEYLHKNNWIIDNIDELIKKKNFDEKVLNIINLIREKKKSFLLMTSNIPPKILVTSLKDLVSRISGSLVVEVCEPDNDLLCKIIEKYLKERSIIIKKSNLEYLINRIERSYKSAVRIARFIDKKSLETHSQINYSFLKKVIEDY